MSNNYIKCFRCLHPGSVFTTTPALQHGSNYDNQNHERARLLRPHNVMQGQHHGHP